MFGLRGKVMLAVVIAGLICLGGFKGYAQTAMEEKIMVAFQDAMNAVLYPKELSIVDLSDYEIREYVVENAAKRLQKAPVLKAMVLLYTSAIK